MQVLMCPSYFESLYDKPDLAFQGAVTLPSQVIGEIDPFTHFASNYRKQQGPCHLSSCLAAALQERDQQLKPEQGRFLCYRNTPTPRLEPSFLVKSCSALLSSIPIPVGLTHSHQPACSAYLYALGIFHQHLFHLVGFLRLLKDLSGTVHQLQQQEANSLKKANHFTPMPLNSIWN